MTPTSSSLDRNLATVYRYRILSGYWWFALQYHCAVVSFIQGYSLHLECLGVLFVETLHRPHQPTVWTSIQDAPTNLSFTRTSATSQRDVVCREVEQLLSHWGEQSTDDGHSTCTDCSLLYLCRMLNHRQRKENGCGIDAWWSSLWLRLVAFAAS